MRGLHIAFALLISAAWGLNFVAIKYAVSDIPVLLATAIRFGAVFLFLLPFFKVPHGHMVRLLSIAFILGVLHFSFMFWAFSMAEGVSAIAIAAQLNVPFATLLAVLFLGEKVGWKRVAGIALSFFGVAIIAFEPNVFGDLDGVMAMVVAAFFYAVSLILMRQLREVPAMTVQVWVALAGFLGAVCLTLIFESSHLEAVSNASASAWYGVLFTIFGASLVGHAGANVLLRRYEVSKVSPYFLTTPVFSLLGAVFILGESLSFKMLFGASLTIVGILIVTLRNNKVAMQRLDKKEQA